MKNWTPLTGISGYSDAPGDTPKAVVYAIDPAADNHRDCERWKECMINQLPEKTSVHAFMHKNHKACWTVKVYPGNTIIEIEWFGTACCRDSAIAKAINEYVEELT
jgi:hypothetical protein